jgi:lysophospholipase L1-like esterase
MARMGDRRFEPSRAKRALFAAIAVGLGSSLSLLFAEVVLRTFEPRLVAPIVPGRELPLLQPNPAGTGSYRLRPNLNLVTRVGHYEISIKTNSHGMRWRELPWEKAAGVKRIAFLGDSFTFGCWAESIEQSFVGVFEQNIFRSRFEVLNFGTGGYGFADMELQLKEQVMRFAPDYVILMSFNGNDFRDTYLGVSKERIVRGVALLDDRTLAARVPPEFLRAAPRASPPAPEPSPLKRALRKFSTYRLLEPLLGTENLALDFRADRNFLSYTFWSRTPSPGVARQAIDESIATVERIRAFLASRGVRLALASLPTRQQVYAEREAGVDFDISFPQVHLQLYARENGIPYLDLLPLLREDVAVDNTQLFVSGDTHLNNEGHELVGRALADWWRCCVKQSAFVDVADE